LFILLPTTAMTDSMAAMPPDSSAAAVRPGRGTGGELEAEGLGKRVRLPDHELTILDGVGFRIGAGEAVAIVGASGSGKSTLLSLLAGLDLPSTGRVLLDGVELSALDEDGRARIRGAKVGFVFQSFQLLPALTALENVMLPLELRGDRDAAGPAAAILGRVGLAERLEHYPRQLSGGEQQRVALARAFVTGPALLFADEPTGNLDTETGRQVIDLLFELNAQAGTTLVLVTHDERLAERCARVLRLDRGRLVPA
jgi:putative ABC transport system ATP-binding protein